MSYTHGQKVMDIGVPGTPLSFTTAGPTIVGTTTCPVGNKPVVVQEIGVTISTAITVTDAVASLLWRPNVASATDEVDLGQITLPVGTPIGTVVRKKVTPQKVGPGGYFVLNVTTAATAGAGYGHVLASDTNEALDNSSFAVESP